MNPKNTSISCPGFRHLLLVMILVAVLTPSVMASTPCSQGEGSQILLAEGVSPGKMWKPIQWVMGNQRRMLQIATIGMCLGLWIMLKR